MCCARLDDFDWVVPDYDPDILLSGRDIEVAVTDLTQDIRVLPDVSPALFDETAAVPMPLLVVVETGSQVGYHPDILLSGREIEVGVTDITQDIRVLPDVFPVMFDEMAAVPMPLPVVVETGPQVDIRWETAPAVVPLAEEMTVCVATVGLSDDGSECPVELPNSESDCCFMDDGVLVPERSPVVSARGAAVPTSLLTISEVFSSAVSAGGGGAVAEPAPLAVAGTVTARVSVLPDVGSELPADSDVGVVVCTALLDEAVDNALDVVGLHVGQLWFRTDPEDALPVMLDEHSLMCDLVRLDIVPVIQDFVSTDVCGDDRFSPGVRNNVSLDWRIDLDSHGMVNWDCQLKGEDRVLAGASDWRSVLRCIALMLCLPEFPDIDCPKCFDDIGRNCIMDFGAGVTCPRVRTPECGLKTFAQTLPTWSAWFMRYLPARSYGCAVVPGCAVARKNLPGTRLVARKTGAI